MPPNESLAAPRQLLRWTYTTRVLLLAVVVLLVQELILGMAPFKQHFRVVDSGAGHACTPDDLLCFAPGRERLSAQAAASSSTGHAHSTGAPPSPARVAELTQRQQRVKAAMQFVWRNYRERAFGADELAPLTGRAVNRWGSIGCMLLDSLDTLWIMGMHDEFQEARAWVARSLTFGKHMGVVSVFETVIRALGGLLSAFDLSQDRVFLDRAVELADLVLPAIDRESGSRRASSTCGDWGASSTWGRRAQCWVVLTRRREAREYRVHSTLRLGSVGAAAPPASSAVAAPCATPPQHCRSGQPSAHAVEGDHKAHERREWS